jgi:hypothetical protein
MRALEGKWHQIVAFIAISTIFPKIRNFGFEILAFLELGTPKFEAKN